MKLIVIVGMVFLAVSCRVSQVVDVMKNKSALVSQTDISGKSAYYVASNGPDTTKAGTIYNSAQIKNLKRFAKQATFMMESVDSLGNFMPFINPGFIAYKFIDDKTFEITLHPSEFEELKRHKKAKQGVNILFKQKIVEVKTSNKKIVRHYKIDNFVRLKFNKKMDKSSAQEKITIHLKSK